MPYISSTRTYRLPSNNIVIAGQVATSVCNPNPRRVGLGFYSSANAVSFFPTTEGVQMSQLYLSASVSNGLWLLWRDVGPLCQTEWYAFSSAGENVTVFEIIEE